MNKNISIPGNSAENISSTEPIDSMLRNAHGKIPYNMTNDYMFRAVLQSNNKVLLNDHSIINLEMQVANRFNWPDRSLLYLCRSFDNLNHGDEYLDIKPAIHIGFLDYTLFEDYPEFYAVNKLMNTKNHHIYNDNFVLNVVDLSHIDLATEEDKHYHIDDWARLFKATTWEELKKMADHNEYLKEASKSIFLYNTDEQIRKMCRDRIEYYQDLHNYERHIAKQVAIIAEKDTVIAEKDNVITEKENIIAALHAQIQELTAESGKAF